MAKVSAVTCRKCWEQRFSPLRQQSFITKYIHFFEENNIDSQTACFLLCHEKIYINGKKAVKRLGLEVGDKERRYCSRLKNYKNVKKEAL